MTLVAFGIEAEWQDGALELATALHNHDGSLLSSNNAAALHGYHCDCDDCGIHSNYMFHAQRDSSCSGELISRKLDKLDSEVRRALDAIESCAVEVDAVPGWDAGFHVHVSREYNNSAHLSKAFFEFMRYEPVLVGIAAGRFNTQRSNNTSVRDLMYGYMAELSGTPWQGRNYPSVDEMLVWLHENGEGSFKSALFQYHHNSDRHSNLAVTSRHPTWEFRLWNSTRAAWRMQLFIQLSRAFMVPAFVSTLAEFDTNPTDEPLLAELQINDALDNADMKDTCALLARQREYMVRVGTISDELTIL